MSFKEKTNGHHPKRIFLIVNADEFYSILSSSFESHDHNQISLKEKNCGVHST